MSTLEFAAAADIGSIEKNRFGWAIRQVEGGATSKGTSIIEFVDALVELLDDERKIALGFECPLFVPVRIDPKELTKSRKGEGNRAWSAGAGAGALTTGLTETAWILRELRTSVKREPKLTFNWEEFESLGGLFLWEAFVSGSAKSSTHAGDAEIAVQAFCNSLPNPERSNMIHEHSVMSLVGASALWAGWAVDTAVLRESCPVISA